MHCCFSEIGSVGAGRGAGRGAGGGAGRGACRGAGGGADCPPPTQPFVFVGFKVKMSSSLGVVAAVLAVAAVCAECVEGGLEFALTIEAQDFISNVMERYKWFF